MRMRILWIAFIVVACGSLRLLRADDAPREKYTPTKDELAQAYDRAASLRAKLANHVFKNQIAPNWLEDNSRFWYCNNLRNGTKEFILVDADHATRAPAFDHQKFGRGVVGGFKEKEVAADRLPFNAIEFRNAYKTLQFRTDGVTWKCDLQTYVCTNAKDDKPPLEVLPPPKKDAGQANPHEFDEDEGENPDPESPVFQPGPGRLSRNDTSPDGKWTALIRDNNVVLRERETNKDTPITKNGEANNAFGIFEWSPDSKTLVAYRTEPGDNKEVYLLESSPRDQLAAKLTKRQYPRPGDKLAANEMYLFDVAAKKLTKVETDRIDFDGMDGGRVPRLRWLKDGSHFLFDRTDRGHQHYRYIEVDVLSGQTRNVIEEKTDTFIDHYQAHYFRYLDATDEILFQSERDGWKHLYLIDARAGRVRNQITKGPWVVRGVDRVDEEKRQVWFRAGGLREDQDPYLIHYCRINFDGSGLVDLTPGNGTHAAPQYSPDKKYLIDTYSRVDMAPVHELRRTADGSLVCDLEKADVSGLQDVGWRFPEVFTAKARDGKTDIWGVVFRPQKFDPAKKYPVIEYIYAGPHSSYVPKAFSPLFYEMQTLAELGFIVVQMDGMGTSNRSRAFHDVCWKNLADAGFPDRILSIKALAQRYPYVDTERVGIFGSSAGGQNTLSGLLFHGDFYKVGYAACGCHDNRLDKLSWNEQWMGVMGPHYAEQSNVTNASKLHGKLMLVVGEMDTNVPPESTMRVADALIKANKDFDFVVLPGVNHTMGGPYGERRRRDFFVRNLHGVEPPERNGPISTRPVE